MPQIQLPMFPSGALEINGDLACQCAAERVVYFHGQLPVFTHAKGDVASFRMFTSNIRLRRVKTGRFVEFPAGVLP